MDIVAKLRETLGLTGHDLVRSADRWELWQVFGDWLTDHGDARGRWIHAAHVMQTGAGSPRERAECRTELRRFTGRHEVMASRWLVGLEVPRSVRLTWVHGFVVMVTLAGASRDAVAFVDTLLRHPTGSLLAKLVVNDAGPLEHLDVTQLSRLVNLELTSTGTHGLARLGAIEDLRGVRRLALRWPRQRHGPDLEPLVGSALFHGLEALRIRGLTLPGSVLERWSVQGGSSSLVELAVDVTDEAGPYVLGSAALPRLTDLEVRRGGLGGLGVAAIAARRGLKRLELRSSAAGDVGAAALARSPSRSTLRVLDLEHSGIGTVGAEALVSADGWALEHLSLGSNPIETPAVLALVRGALPRRLRRLDLSYANLGDKAALAVAGCDRWSELERLDMVGNRFSARVRRTVLASRNLHPAAVRTW